MLIGGCCMHRPVTACCVTCLACIVTHSMCPASEEGEKRGSDYCNAQQSYVLEPQFSARHALTHHCTTAAQPVSSWCKKWQWNMEYLRSTSS